MQILAVFMVRTLSTDKARCQEPSAGLMQPGRRSVTQMRRLPSILTRPGYAQQPERHPLDSRCPARNAPAAVAAWEDTDTSPHLVQLCVSSQWLLRHYGTSQTLPSNSSAQWASPIQCCWSGFPSQVSCVLLRNDRHMGLSTPHNTPQPGFPLGNTLSEGPVAPLAEFPLGEEETDCCSPASSLAPILLLLSEGKA